MIKKTIAIFIILLMSFMMISCVLINDNDYYNRHIVKQGQVLHTNGYFVDQVSLSKLKNGGEIKNIVYFEKGEIVSKDGFLLPTNIVYTDGYGTIILKNK